MKHLVIINKSAGNCKNYDFNAELKKAFKGISYDVYETKGPRDVIPFIKKYLTKNKDLVRIYACGGDGSIHEIVNAVIGFDNAEIAIMPLGTGNDFIKVYGATNKTIDEYRNLESLVKGDSFPVDISKITGGNLKEPWYSNNVINFGFDAIVGAKGNINKQKGYKNPYGARAIIPAILRGRFNNIIVSADGEQLNFKRLLLSSVAQGQWVGAQYHASPKSDNTDGLIDIVVIKCMSFARLMIQYFKKYTNGQHLDNPKLMKRIIYRQAKRINIDAPKDIDICVDGEMIRGSHFEVECMPKAIKIVVPTKK